MTGTRNNPPPPRAGSGHPEPVKIDLGSLPAMAGDGVVAFAWSNVRPLKGVLGLLDWRLNGHISQAIMGGAFEGAAGTTLLIPTSGRLGQNRLFLIGLGPWYENAGLAAFVEGCARASEVVIKAGVKSVTLCLPSQGLHSESLPDVASALQSWGQPRVEAILTV